MNISRNDKKDFILLITGSDDNDRAAERAAQPGQDIVRCKISYVPVFEKFDEIKKLQRALRNSQYLKGRHISCALDISEWIGHEEEEFFTLSLKYLHDHRSRISYIFTVGAASEEEARAVYFRLRCFMRGGISSDMTFIGVGKLCGYIESKNTERPAARLLAEMMMRDEMKSLRTYPSVDIMCEELRETCGLGRSDTVSLRHTEKYLRDSDSLPAILCRETAQIYADAAAQHLRIKRHETFIA